MGQASIGTTATLLTVFPPGPCSVTISNLSTANTVYVGLSTATTTSGADAGYPVTNATSPVTIPGFNGSAGSNLYAIASATATTVGYVVSTATGGTGL